MFTSSVEVYDDIARHEHRSLWIGAARRLAPFHQTGLYLGQRGTHAVHLNAYVSDDFSKYWAGSVAATLGRLQHYAAESPIIERRVELNTLASFNYRF
jgi:outer membrane protein